MGVEYHTIDENSLTQRLDNYLIKNLKGVPKSLVYRIIRKGNVRVNKGRKKADYKLQLGDIVRIPPLQTNPKDETIVSEALSKLLRDNILYEDEGLIVLNKPSGLASHGGSGIVIGVIEAMRQLYGDSLELVHRIDRSTSGCLLIAKKRKVLIALQAQLSHGQMHKRYWALLKNSWQKKQHTIDAPLLKNTNSRQHKVSVDNAGQTAVSHFHPLKNINFQAKNLKQGLGVDLSVNFKNDITKNITKDTAPDEQKTSVCLAQVVIETGRMHQIRVHAHYTGHAIVGDDKYGDEAFNLLMRRQGIARLCLHAQQLQFINPTTGQRQTINAPIDEALLAKINQLSAVKT